MGNGRFGLPVVMGSHRRVTQPGFMLLIGYSGCGAIKNSLDGEQASRDDRGGN
jgi:hypothetical protein